MGRQAVGTALRGDQPTAPNVPRGTMPQIGNAPPISGWEQTPAGGWQMSAPQGSPQGSPQGMPQGSPQGSPQGMPFTNQAGTPMIGYTPPAPAPISPFTAPTRNGGRRYQRRWIKENQGSSMQDYKDFISGKYKPNATFGSPTIEPYDRKIK